MKKTNYDLAGFRLLDGDKMWNIRFSQDEFIYMRNGIILDEKGHKLGRLHAEFWSKNMVKLPRNQWYILNDEDMCIQCKKALKSAGSDWCGRCIDEMPH